jgi:hypothetical protein
MSRRRRRGNPYISSTDIRKYPNWDFSAFLADFLITFFQYNPTLYRKWVGDRE